MVAVAVAAVAAVAAGWWRCGGGAVAVRWRCGGGAVEAVSIDLGLAIARQSESVIGTDYLVVGAPCRISDRRLWREGFAAAFCVETWGVGCHVVRLSLWHIPMWYRHWMKWETDSAFWQTSHTDPTQNSLRDGVLISLLSEKWSRPAIVKGCDLPSGFRSGSATGSAA